MKAVVATILLLSARVVQITTLTIIPDYDFECEPEGIPEFCPGAPADFDPKCRSGLNRANHIFPENWRVVLDTYDYPNLYDSGRVQPPAVWEVGNFDGDNFPWRQIVGGICTWSLYICNFHTPNQNNWLFSQHVCLGDAKEVYFNVSYRFTQCRNNPSCHDDYLTLYHYDTDGFASTEERTNIDNYQPLFGDEVSSRLKQTSASVTRSFLRPQPRRKGFHLGVKDSGTCGQVNRIIMYYTVCLARQNGLVLYPEYATPPKDGPDEIFHAKCVCHAHPVTNMAVIASSETSTCKEEADGGAMCECDGGYYISDDLESCLPCAKGFYRAAGESNTCQPCPPNTTVDAIAAAQCECLSGLFRDVPNEGPGSGCTKPPLAPTELQVVQATNTTVTISWRFSLARHDDYFDVCYKNFVDFAIAICEEKFIPASTCLESHCEYTIRKLTPFSSYLFNVSAQNGVSDQDSQNNDRRVATFVDGTTEGVPNSPFLKRLCTVVIWKPPTRPSGIIKAYDLCFGQCSGQSLLDPTCYNFAADDNFFVTSDEMRAQDIGVQIRTNNSIASSPWTECLPIDCAKLNKPSASCPLEVPNTDTPTTRPPTTSTPTTIPPSTQPATRPPTTQPATRPPTTQPATRPPTTQPTTSPPITLGAGPVLEACPTFTSDFLLRGVEYNSGDTVCMEHIGEGNNALLCGTNYAACCAGGDRFGDFEYPNGSRVSIERIKHGFYRNRACRYIRLNRREAVSEPLGEFSCIIYNDGGIPVSRNIFIESCSSLPMCEDKTAPEFGSVEIEGRTAHFSCDQNYEPVGSSTSTCLPDGTWTNPAPTCAIPCVDKTAPDFGSVEIEGGTAHFSCDQEYELVGSSTSTCLPDGTWTNPAPTCVCERPQFVLGDRVLPIGSTVSLSDISTGSGALFCQTSYERCCRNPVSGEFLFPSGENVEKQSAGGKLFRNRGFQFIRLNNKLSDVSQVASGSYKCCLPDACGVDTCISIFLES